MKEANTKYGSKNKAELKQLIKELPYHHQPRWMQKANKNELKNWLISIDKYNQAIIMGDLK